MRRRAFSPDPAKNWSSLLCHASAVALCAASLAGCERSYLPLKPPSPKVSFDTILGESDAKLLKKGESCARSIFSLVAYGDASIEAAKRQGGVVRVVAADRQGRRYFLVYATLCTTVLGE